MGFGRAQARPSAHEKGGFGLGFGRAQARPSAHVKGGFGLGLAAPRRGPAPEHARGAIAVLCAAFAQAHWRTMHRRMPGPVPVCKTTISLRRKEQMCCAAGQPGCRASGARQAPCTCWRARRVPRCRAAQVVHDLEGCADAPAPPENGASEGTAPGAATPPPGAPPRLSFYLDGAHTEESMATCAAWFAGAVGAADPRPDRQGQGGSGAAAAGGDVQRVLLFNCMPARARPALGRADCAGAIMVPALSDSTRHPWLLREARTSAAPQSRSVAGIPMARCSDGAAACR